MVEFWFLVVLFWCFNYKYEVERVEINRLIGNVYVIFFIVFDFFYIIFVFLVFDSGLKIFRLI